MKKIILIILTIIPLSLNANDNAKEKNKIAINSLGEKTLHDTMEIVNNFINHENK